MQYISQVEILLVEDNPADIELTLHALKKYNLRNPIHVIKDGAETVDFLFCTGKYSGREAQKNPKLILLDLKLPKMDGIEVLKKIKSNRKTKNIPVVMLTSSSQESDILRSYDLGVNSYIVKPINFESFMEAIEKVGSYWLILNKNSEDT